MSIVTPRSTAAEPPARSQAAARPEPPAAAPAAPPVPERFKAAFRGHPAGVVVITVPGPSGPAGFTATSLASLSLDPPLVSFGIATTASSWPHVRDGGTAVVHFLAEGHEELARRFATSGIDRFAEPTRYTRLPDGEPLLDGVTNWLLISLESLIPAGDHRLVIGRVTHAATSPAHRPLLYHDGTYHSITDVPDTGARFPVPGRQGDG
ncbi:flavin reductase family protein [Actinacidiphila sp. ITFR-21]|uniref:flavin reductase family protein n=1 Tax=Actinacidiphila sp. ITFR-21 TaxID=3075199 RepID=UPI00288AE5D8|nr:flavin reductase family protein [Streptomyces sp. ITFR-21]WNI14827.1 flavin reductase family protein [Streptomyces sp. ITFR-21]